jgi:hypothetical protein
MRQVRTNARIYPSLLLAACKRGKKNVFTCAQLFCFIFLISFFNIFWNFGPGRLVRAPESMTAVFLSPSKADEAVAQLLRSFLVNLALQLTLQISHCMRRVTVKNIDATHGTSVNTCWSDIAISTASSRCRMSLARMVAAMLFLGRT